MTIFRGLNQCLVTNTRTPQPPPQIQKGVASPIEFGLSVAQIQEQFPAPDKYEYDPMVNKKVTMLARDTGSGRFTFFFYEDKLYKIVIVSKWSNYTIQFAEEDIKKLKQFL
jgi:hypothetical protein